MQYETDPARQADLVRQVLIEMFLNWLSKNLWSSVPPLPAKHKQDFKSSEKVMKHAGSTSDMLQLLTKATCYLFAEDPTRPSIVVSHLQSNQYYISIVRYGEKYAKSKRIVFKTKNASFDEAVYSAACWVSDQVPKAKNPVEALGDFLVDRSVGTTDFYGQD